MHLSHQDEAELIRRGAKVTYLNRAALEPQEPGKGKAVAPRLVEPGVAVMVNVATGQVEKLVAFVPVETKSEINQSKSQWKAASRRTGAAWRAVSATFGPHLDMLAPFAEAYHAGKSLRLTFVRLGGRKLDAMDNLGTSMKFVQDALAYLMGANDGDVRWQATAGQEPGGDVGVRIEITVLE